MIGPLSLFAVEALELITMGVDTKFGRLSRRVYVRVGPMASLFTITTSSSSSSEMMVAAVEAAASSRGFFGGDIFCFLSKAQACGKQLVINILLHKKLDKCLRKKYTLSKEEFNFFYRWASLAAAKLCNCVPDSSNLHSLILVLRSVILLIN